MASKITFHFQRYELKYWLTPERYFDVKEQLNRFLELDSYSVPAPGHAYPIWSLYLDTPGLASYEDKVDGLKDRQKFRLRTYAPDSPIFLEIKKRANKIILKDRLLLGAKEAEEALEGFPDALIEKGLPADQRQTLDQFLFHRYRFGLAPKLCVRYDREAYFGSVDKNVRVTFDRNIAAKKCRSLPDMLADVGDWFHSSDARIILEIKVYNKMPLWLVDVIRRNNLEQDSISKYCRSVEMLYEEMAAV